jgi:WD40 repeat protein
MSNKVPKWANSLTTVSWVNSAAISDDGQRIVGGTFLHDYPNNSMVHGTFGTFAYDAAGNQLWADTLSAWDGVFAVAISGDGSVAAGGGNATKTKGLLKIFDAATGAALLNSTSGSPSIPGRVNIISLSRTGSVAATAANGLHVFLKSGASYTRAASATPASDPKFKTALGRVAAVSVHPDGTWLAACNQKGQILIATIAAGKVKRTFLWQAPQEPVNPNSASSPTAPVRFLSVAISSQADSFVAGGSDVVYRGSLADMMSGISPVRYDAGDPAAPVGNASAASPMAKPNVRWTAISGDGLTFAAAANRTGGANGTGQLLIFNKGTLTPVAKAPLPHNPNGISMDQAGTIIAVADGYPVGKPANFYRFDSSGAEIWRCPTGNMNWPVAVSADGSAIAAGGDDGDLYYFVP